MTPPTPASDTAAARALVEDFSLEMTGKDIPALLEARAVIPQGTKINVTFLGNEDLPMRVAAAKAVRDNGFLPVPHISARRLSSETELREFLNALGEVGALDSVFAVGGDPSEPLGPYASAYDLIATGIFQEYGVREVNIAGYPEGHPDIPTPDLWDQLEMKASSLKLQGLETTILTQFGFDTDPILTWIQDVRGRGIDATIRLGVPGPAGIKRLLGFARRFGIGANTAIVKKYGFSITNLLGTAGPDTFVNDLAAELAAQPATGSVKIHLYAFGGLLATSEWAREFKVAPRTSKESAQ
ncbi:methylenetetrahydrofolate reductase [Microbacterium sp. HD4P20]|uniref:methylenetetrahydrofolate reductase n=1 Tax=Microbacterium sp. HD4P20 TaxID=2864874 RepID=UPI001C640ADF|nr:methylenetetrahydrofolate reductase [Microbacterium sp. HD4P20]MCP2636048.1 methylenetetrahydrofolate reductase [Microbacterium sp. HD4P20]